MRYQRKIIPALMIAGGVIATPFAAQADGSTELEHLRALVQELDQKIRIIERKSELAVEEAAKVKSEQPIVRTSDGAFGLESADGKFKFKLGTLFQGDYRYIDTDIAGVKKSDFLLRRAQIDFRGTVFSKYDFRLLSEFAPETAGILDAYVNARFAPGFKVQFGKFKSPSSLERLQSGAALKFVDRTYIADSLLPNRDIGLQVHGDLLGEKLNYTVGVFDGQVDGAGDGKIKNEDSNTEKDFVWRVFLQPFKDGGNSALAGLGFGISGTWGDTEGRAGSTSLTNGYRTPGRQTFFAYRKDTSAADSVFADGNRLRWSPQGYYYGPFGLLAEYARVSQDVTRINGAIETHANLEHDAWQVAASWILTGENNSFGVIKPRQPFDFDNNGLGAWEVALRYSELNVDKDTFRDGANSFAEAHKSARSAKSWAVGLNWHLNSFVKFATTFEHTEFNGGAGTVLAVRDRPDENVLSTRFQLAF